MKYIAFLRAINVGGHFVKMDKLKEIFAQLELENVGSYIQSGNIFFETNEVDRKALTVKIEGHLLESLKYPVIVFLRSIDEVDKVISSNPFKDFELTLNKHFFCYIHV